MDTPRDRARLTQSHYCPHCCLPKMRKMQMKKTNCLKSCEEFEQNQARAEQTMKKKHVKRVRGLKDPRVCCQGACLQTQSTKQKS